MTARKHISIILILLGIISVLHYETAILFDSYHDIYRRLYYIPIVLGGVWFQLRGGIGVALLTTLIYGPHVLFQWGGHETLLLEQSLEILLYNVIGFLTGLLSHKEWQQKIRYRQAANDLEQSYLKLREQTDILIGLEKQLENTARLSALGELSASLAHEVRNPLASIRLVADNLNVVVEEGTPESEYLVILTKETGRLNQVVEQYLAMARNDRGDQQNIDLNHALDEIFKLVHQQAIKQHVELVFKPQNIPVFKGAEVQLKQAFLNLALNAIQAMPGGGTLKVSCLHDEGQLIIHFEDNGCGLGDSNPDDMFTPFYSNRPGGTGLGLSITRKIVESHGGWISAENLKQGSLFTINLPLIME